MMKGCSVRQVGAFSQHPRFPEDHGRPQRVPRSILLGQLKGNYISFASHTFQNIPKIKHSNKKNQPVEGGKIVNIQYNFSHLWKNEKCLNFETMGKMDRFEYFKNELLWTVTKNIAKLE